MVESPFGGGVEVGADDREVDQALERAPAASGGALLDLDGSDGALGLIVRIWNRQVDGEAQELGGSRGEVLAWLRLLDRATSHRTPRTPFDVRGSPVIYAVTEDAQYRFSVLHFAYLSVRGCPITCASSPCERCYRLRGGS